MEMPGHRRLTRKYYSELHSKGGGLQLSSPGFAAVAAAAAAQPALQSAPGSLADQAAQMEQFGGFARKSTEELFIQSFVESSTKVMPSAAENLGLAQVTELDKFSRGDSEELFSSWVSAGTQTQNTEVNPVGGSPCRPQRPRHEPRRVSGELAAILKQQNNFNNNFTLSSIDFLQRVDGVEDAYKTFLDTEASFEPNPKSRLSNGTSKQARSAPNLIDSKVTQRLWLDSEAPVTRSRSSELRRRFAEAGAVPAPQINVTTMPVPYKEANPAAAMNGWTSAAQTLALAPTSDPSTSQPAPVNNSLSDYVVMLKGSLNRAKQRLGSQPGNQPGVSEDAAKGKKAQPQSMNGDLSISPPGILDSSSIRMKQNGSRSKWPSNGVEKPVHANGDNVSSRSIDESTYGFQSAPPVAQISDSSGGAPNGGLGNSNERMCTSTQANLVGGNKNLKRGNAEMDHILAEPISMSDLDGLEFQGSVKNQEHLPKVPDTLRRMGSINSAARSDYGSIGMLRSPDRHGRTSMEGIDDATKKRRVDRQRKMAEAKGRGATSIAGPPDLQAALKRLDALEKEVRSLRMNLSFMNRKDSEQTKHIEELEEENKELKRMNLNFQGRDMQI